MSLDLTALQSNALVWLHLKPDGIERVGHTFVRVNFMRVGELDTAKVLRPDGLWTVKRDELVDDAGKLALRQQWFEADHPGFIAALKANAALPLKSSLSAKEKKTGAKVRLRGLDLATALKMDIDEFYQLRNKARELELLGETEASP